MTDLKLDFSGGENSWFDMWHYHPHIDNQDNDNPENRRKHFRKLEEVYNYLKHQLQHYPHAFQLWMLISENDRTEDAIYIHTKNPNGTEFPLKFPTSKNYITKDKYLAEFITNSGFEAVEAIHNGEKYFYLFENH